jgi:hypothetical protein
MLANGRWDLTRGLEAYIKYSSPEMSALKTHRNQQTARLLC